MKRQLKNFVGEKWRNLKKNLQLLNDENLTNKVYCIDDME